MKRIFFQKITCIPTRREGSHEHESSDCSSFLLCPVKENELTILFETNVIQSIKHQIMRKWRFITLIFIVMFINSMLLKGAEYIDASMVSSNVKYNLVVSVPDDYNPSQSYSLVVGLQPCMSATTKSYLIALKPLTDSLKMIVICPDLSKTGNWMTDANMNVIVTSIDSAMAMFNIDPKSVYLTGMSCNGATTLQQGLKKMYPFKGIFPWAPYISNADPKVMDMNSDMPVTIAVGTSDGVLAPNLSLYDSLKTHGAKVNLVLVEGIAHTYEFANFGNEMIHSINYLNDTNTISINYSEAILPNFEINDTDPAKELEFEVTNLGEKELNFKSISSNTIVIGNPEITYTPANHAVKLKFSPKVGKAGKSVIVLEASEKNGSAVEQVTFKVKVTKTVAAVTLLESSPKLEVYPNPASDHIYLKSEEKNLSVQISDLNGRVVLETTNINNSSVDISQLKKGMYLIRVYNKNYSSNSIFSVHK
jgi:hypothetical protein